MADATGANATVVAVVVSYEPDIRGLGRLLDALGSQVAHTLVVDNGSRIDVAAILAGRLQASLISLGENRGIAVAQNVGIADTKARAADYVILFDQDSLPDNGMVGALVQTARGVAPGTLAAVGPVPVDNRGRRLEGNADRHRGEGGVARVDALIASGSLVPIAALDAVGPLREDLFIDLVDTEWCLRAQKLGLVSYIDRGVTMQHEYGEVREVLGVRFTSRIPVRHYYMVRNFIWLLRQGWVPLVWKLRSLPRFVLQQVVSATLAPPRGVRWQMIGRAIRDGLAGRTGPIDG
jgi:rhamnosyltransferase